MAREEEEKVFLRELMATTDCKVNQYETEPDGLMEQRIFTHTA